MRSINANPTDPYLYYSLGTDLPEGEQIKLISGEEVTKLDLLLKAISLDPKQSEFYNNLACQLQKDEKIKLLNGEELTEIQLYFRALQLEYDGRRRSHDRKVLLSYGIYTKIQKQEAAQTSLARNIRTRKRFHTKTTSWESHQLRSK